MGDHGQINRTTYVVETAQIIHPTVSNKLRAISNTLDVEGIYECFNDLSRK